LIKNIVEIRKRAFEKLKQGDVNEAFNLIYEVFDTNQYTLDDIYLAGEWALDSGKYDTAIDLLTQTLSESEKLNEPWYVDSALLARAYARILTSDFDQAVDDLSKIKENVRLTWLRNHPTIDKNSILAKLNRSEEP
jgi:tetratricopeptide (TPR) repeat protein